MRWNPTVLLVARRQRVECERQDLDTAEPDQSTGAPQFPAFGRRAIGENVARNDRTLGMIDLPVRLAGPIRGDEALCAPDECRILRPLH